MDNVKNNFEELKKLLLGALEILEETNSGLMERIVTLEKRVEALEQKRNESSETTGIVAEEVRVTEGVGVTEEVKGVEDVEDVEDVAYIEGVGVGAEGNIAHGKTARVATEAGLFVMEKVAEAQAAQAEIAAEEGVVVAQVAEASTAAQAQAVAAVVEEDGTAEAIAAEDGMAGSEIESAKDAEEPVEAVEVSETAIMEETAEIKVAEMPDTQHILEETEGVSEVVDVMPGADILEGKSIGEESIEGESILNEESVVERESVGTMMVNDMMADMVADEQQRIVNEAAKPDWYDWEVDYPAEYVDDVYKGISFNDRYEFVKELFNVSGNLSEAEILFKETLDVINETDTFKKVVAYMREKFPQWDEQSDEVYRFYMAVRRKFNR